MPPPIAAALPDTVELLTSVSPAASSTSMPPPVPVRTVTSPRSAMSSVTWTLLFDTVLSRTV